jgi:hypothetical protein
LGFSFKACSIVPGLVQEKHKAAPASERMLVLFTKLGWEWDDG